MTPTFSKVCIVGAGAIGGWIGAGLARAGCQVSVFARGATLAALQTHGLRMGAEQHDVHASAEAAELGVQDLVVIAVKAPSLRDVVQQIGPLIGAHTVILTAMNGVPWWFLQGMDGDWAHAALRSVDPQADIGQAIPIANVIGCVVHASCSVDAPGVIRHHFGYGLVVGEPFGGTTPRVQALGDLLRSAGFATTVSERIQRDVWFKLWGNMTINPISALTGATVDHILGDDLVRDFASNVMLEAKEIGARLGLEIDQQPSDRHQVTLKLGAFKTSMLQDLEGGKPVELDALVTAVKELALLTEVKTPFLDALLGLARLQARARGLYGTA